MPFHELLILKILMLHLFSMYLLDMFFYKDQYFRSLYFKYFGKLQKVCLYNDVSYKNQHISTCKLFQYIKDVCIVCVGISI